MQTRINANTNTQTPGILVLSHGPLAIALLESAELIYGGPIENAAAFTLEEDDEPGEYREAFMNAYHDMPAGSLILMDIFGGSPCNQLMIGAKREGLHVLAIAGINLPTLLNATFLRNTYEGESLVQKLVEEGQESMINVTERLR
ncbi:PTS sugar transporter subunit IIA [Eubacteriales bacterium OttesenSCG-928-N14]|nr:PTS sugar transporter subunit IIA [Eubacteriales bacterium OttesenSCG-928-N14]